MARRWIPALLALALGAGGAHPAAGRLIGRSAEISVGRETASVLEQYLTVDRDPAAVERVRRIGRRLVSGLDDPDYPFEFHVVESPEINAFALPGGFIYVYRGLLQLSPSEDALAFVLAHEISHVTRSHAIRQFEKSLVLRAGVAGVLAGTGAGFGTRRAADVGQAVLGLSFTRGDETDADRNGIALMARTGYDPREAVTAMELVRRTEGEGRRIPALFRTHPAPESRIRRLRELGEHLRREEPPAGPAPEPLRLAPPVPDPSAPRGAASPWWPLVKGDRWEYRISRGETQTDLRVTVLGPAPPRLPGAFRVEYDFGGGIRVVRLLVTAGGRCLSRPERDGAGWQVEAVLPGAGEAPGFRETGRERVRVPAGEYETVRVEEEGDDGRPRVVSWYAAGVGLVRRETAATGTVQELVAYLPASPAEK